MAVDRAAIIAQTIEKIRKQLPDQTIGLYKDVGKGMDVDTISTGSLAADYVLGGGLAKGRIINIVGHTSAGKTTLALTAIAKLQREKPDAMILYVDAEFAIDPRYAKALGVDMDHVFVIQPDYGEAAYTAAEMFIASGVADLVIIDSIAACIPKAMFDVELGEQAQIGMGARLDSQGISRICGPAHKYGTTVILINQWKKAVRTSAWERTDGISGNFYQPGGETFKFYVSQMIEVQRIAKIVEGGVHISNQTRVRVLKNKIAPPGREADFYITFGVGLDRAQEIIELGTMTKIIEKVGRSVYYLPGYDDIRFNGRQKVVDYLHSKPEIMNELYEKIRNSLASSVGDSGDVTFHADEAENIDPNALAE